MSFLQNYFGLEKRGTTVRTELLAGLTTFLAMAYILPVNSNILSTTGMGWGAVFTATAIAAIVATMIMGLVSNYPVALAPGMGMNAMFAFTLCLPVAAGGLGYHWSLALAAVFVSGIVVILITLTGAREAVINAIPKNLKLAVGAGIGLFVAFVGLQNSNLIVANPETKVALGNFTDPAVLLTIIGLIITVILYVLKVPAAIFIGMIVTAIAGIGFRLVLDSQGLMTEALEMSLPALPSGILSLPDAPEFGAFLKGFTLGDWSDWSFLFSFIVIVFSLIFVDFFDTTGTLVSVGSNCGMINEEGQLEDSGKALFADATGTVVGAIVGTSSTTSFVESLAGVEVGGRTGLTAVFTSIFFLIALFFSPILSIITAPVTAPALIFVGILMCGELKHIEWDKIEIAIPAFLTVTMMPLTYSISDGIAIGFIFYPISMLAAKRGKEVSPVMYILALLFVAYFALTSIF